MALSKRYRWLRPIRAIGLLVLGTVASSCAFCIDNIIPPQAVEHTSFCAQYYAQGKLTEAEARCRLAREFAPKYAEPVNLLGLIALSRGQNGKAKELFKRALSLRNDFAEAHNNLGAIFLEDQDYGQACDAFKQATEIDPGYVDARINLGTCYFYGDQKDLARDEYLKCVELDPKICDCRLGLGAVALGKKDFQDAKAHFQKMTEICPQNPDGFYNLCYAYYALGRCGDAVDSCMSALAIKSDHIEAKQNLTQAYECLALETGAIRHLVDKIRRQPGDPDLHFQLGTVYEEKRLYDRALNEYLNTIKLDSRHIMAHYRAARIYDDQMRAQETIDMCKRFVDMLRGRRYAKQQKWCVDRVRELQYQ